MGEELVVPGTGELVDLDDENQVIPALRAIRVFEQSVREVKQVLSNAIVVRSQVLGKRTIHVEGLKAEVSRGSETVYDAEAIEIALRHAGCPEERIREVIVETVTLKVDAREIKILAAANPAYDRVIKEHSREVQKPAYVTIKG